MRILGRSAALPCNSCDAVALAHNAFKRALAAVTSHVCIGRDLMIDVYDLAVRSSRHLRGSIAPHIHLVTGEASS